MAGYRQIHPEIWSDPWFSELNPKEKITFIYLFSNDRSSLCGLYEITLRQIAFDTGCDIKETEKIIEKFIVDGKIVFENNTILVKNMWEKHQTTSEKVLVRVKRDITAIEDCQPKQVLIDIYPDLYTLSIPYRYPIDTETHEVKDEDESLINLNQDEVVVNGNNGALLGKLSELFTDLTHIEPNNLTKPKWLEAENKLIRAGVSEDDLTMAVLEMQKKPTYKITSLQSIVTPAIQCQNKRIGRQLASAPG